MLSDSLSLSTGTKITNTTIERGATLPASPTEGELFYLNTGAVGTYIYQGAAWVQITDAAGVKSGGGGSGGITFAVGTVFESPTAPADGGTWLACDGSTLSQATYASLYSAVGHNYLRYTHTSTGITSGSIPSENIVGAVWTGNKFVFASTTSNDVWYSTDGTGTSFTHATQTQATAISMATNGAGTVVILAAGVSTCSTSTTDGQTWANHSVGLTLQQGSTVQWNGSYFMIITGGQYTVSSPDGVTWTTHANVRSNSSGQPALWFASQWWAQGSPLTTAALDHLRVEHTSDLAGSTGWINTACQIPIFRATVTLSLIPATNGSIVVVPGAPAPMWSTDMLTWYGGRMVEKGVMYPIMHEASAPYRYTAIVWNGLHFVVYGAQKYVTTNSPTPFTTTAPLYSLDGKNWYANEPTATSVPVSYNNYNYCYPSANSSYTMCLPAGITGDFNSTVGTTFVTVAPSIDTTINFTLPKYSYTAWIKAA